jgi:predicted Zn-dependent protease
VKKQILGTLRRLRQYALQKGYEIELFYHEEDSYLMRYANSAISLNTNEHLIRLAITAHSGRKRASYNLITDPSKTDEMERGIDVAAEMVEHSQPLSYQPTVPVLGETFIDESGYDEGLAQLASEAKLHHFNQAVEGLETEDIKLSGIFSCGSNTVALTNTNSEHALYFRTSDAQVTMVLAHEALKWEVIAEQSAQKGSDLDPLQLHQDLALLIDHYQHDTPQQLPLGTYDIVFGPAATAEMVSFMNWIGFDGGLMKRDFSFLREELIDQKVFSDKFTLTDNPDRIETFPYKMDFTGIPRKPYPIIQNGVFQGFVWNQDDADEFGAKPTGHTVEHKSLILDGGDKDVRSLAELISTPRKRDVLYIPFLHYMNIVNPSKGVITASSRFGALLLKEDGSVTIPYNVRLTQSLLDVFGDKVDWLSRSTVPYNTSHSYGARNPTAVIVPSFIQVNGLEISHSNPSY